MPAVHSQTSDYDAPVGWYAGPWPTTKPVTLYAANVPGGDYAWRLLPKAPKVAPGAPQATFVPTGANTESSANQNPRADNGWLWFESAPLARAVRIFGEAKVRLRSSVDRTWITYTPTVVDIDPAQRASGPGTLQALDDRGRWSATRGWLDTRYRNGRAEQSLLDPGKPFTVTIVEKPQDYTFKRGHLIGLMVQTEINDWSLPKLYPGCLSLACTTVRVHWEAGETALILPIVGAPSDPSTLFAAG
jgi:predicted acyl esterase